MNFEAPDRLHLLDAAPLDRLFTLKMKPTKVRLRLLKSPSGRQYLAVQRP